MPKKLANVRLDSSNENNDDDDSKSLGIVEESSADDSFFSYASEMADAEGGAPDPKESVLNELKDLRAIIKPELRGIYCFRVATVLLLLATGASVSYFVFSFFTRAEVRNYTAAYYLLTKSIADITRLRVETLFTALNDESVTLTAHAKRYNEQFPFVTIPNFEVEGQHTRQRANVEVFSFMPKVYAANRSNWESYATANTQWIENSRNTSLLGNDQLSASNYGSTNISPILYDVATGEPDYAQEQDFYYPLWQQSPPPFEPILVNFDLNSLSYVRNVLDAVEIARESLIGPLGDVNDIVGTAYTAEDHDSYHSRFVEPVEGQSTLDRPHAYMYTPVFEKIHDKSSPIVGALIATLPFDLFMANLLPDGTEGIYCVIRSSCGEEHTYLLTGTKAKYIGEGDLTDECSSFSDRVVIIPFHDYQDTENVRNLQGHCVYSFFLYPSHQFSGQHQDALPFIFTCISAITFALLTMTFFVYEWFAAKRNQKLVADAVHSRTIVSRLFPSAVKNQLLRPVKKRGALEDDTKQHESSSQIADLFPDATIMCADISGFTAWSSYRSPVQVFSLLETIFDAIAVKRGVYKVETVGDCYIAVCGLPDPRKDHHLVMARFARDCLVQMRIVTKALETTYGPDTAELSLRIGLHSGPVTAGVLRGERSRFQLFGDTMHEASRMESTGVPNLIQISKDTANLLAASGKSSWLKLREDADTSSTNESYWLFSQSNFSDSTISGSAADLISETQVRELQNDCINDISEGEKITELESGKTSRLIAWNVELLCQHLERVVAQRHCTATSSNQIPHKIAGDELVIDQMQELIRFHELVGCQSTDVPKQGNLDDRVVAQLTQYVTNIAAMYRPNAYHNFDHACHVTMSANKLLLQVAEQNDDVSPEHRQTNQILSLPLVQFSCLFSGLIHDLDHPGVPNSQMTKEGNKIAQYYRHQSVAEQNSVELAFSLLDDPSYSDLRLAIFPTEIEGSIFRQVVIHLVLATDVTDVQLNQLRNKRWELVYGPLQEQPTDRSVSEWQVNRMATIVLECLMQTATVSHAMQYWEVYRKWNERLFFEAHDAYREGRTAENPADTWYTGERDFFESVVFPLVKRLGRSGCFFSASSAEYRNCAMANRAQWEQAGPEIVAHMSNIAKGRGLVQPEELS